MVVHRSSRSWRASRPRRSRRVDRAARQLEQPGDLARRVLEEVAEHDHGALLRRQRREARDDVVRQARGGIVGGRGGEGVAADLRAERPCAGPVDRPIDDDPVQPGPERPAPVEAVERAHGREERLLGDVLGGSGVVDDQEGGAVRARPVRAEEGLEVGGRSGLGAAHPGALAARARHPEATIRARLRTRSIRACAARRGPGPPAPRRTYGLRRRAEEVRHEDVRRVVSCGRRCAGGRRRGRRRRWSRARAR